LGHPSKFQRVSGLGFVTAPTSLNGDQPNFERCFAVSWAGTLCIHFWGSCPLTKFCQVQYSLCVQVFRSPILATLLYGTSSVCQPNFAASDKEGSYETFALRSRHLYSTGRSSRWASAHILVHNMLTLSSFRSRSKICSIVACAKA